VSRVLGREGRPKTGKSKREVVPSREPRRGPPKPSTASPKARRLRFHDTERFADRPGELVRPGVGANASPPEDSVATLRQHQTHYISYMLELGAKPLWVARQTGTSLEMIEKHYGRAKVVAQKLDSLISNATERATRHEIPLYETGTFPEPSTSTNRTPLTRKKKPSTNRGLR
jgi:hypothetical protein